MTLSGQCTCVVSGPDYDQTKFDRACPFHGEDGSMVATINLSSPPALTDEPGWSHIDRMVRADERRKIANTHWVCEDCGRLGPMSAFRDECRPGWTHGRLIGVVEVADAE